MIHAIPITQTEVTVEIVIICWVGESCIIDSNLNRIFTDIVDLPKATEGEYEKPKGTNTNS